MSRHRSLSAGVLVIALLGLGPWPRAATAAPRAFQGEERRADARTVATRQTKATVREYTKTIRTYPFADPNPIAAFEGIYPYFRYDRYTNAPVDRAWRIVELENAFLRVLVLPEIGGKIWTAIDKSTGRAFIYENHVVKFRDVAMRGPWTSGGIEANYGIIGHTPNVATPVDYVTGTRADGTASVTIGTLDLLTRTAWRLEVALPPDKAYFTTRSLWQNTSGIEQPYYSWLNAGLRAAGHLEFVYPGNQYLGHAGEVGAWPIHPDNHKNLAFYDQNDFGSYKSYHVVGTHTDFFGAYWHDDDFGMARYSRRDEKPGKKIWIWGLSRQGMIWEQLLTDSDGQYVEVQSGRLFNQAAEGSSLTPFKHRSFLPYATDTWTEYWFPVKGTKGFVKANDFGALNVRARAGSVDLAFSPLERIDAVVEVFDGEARVHAEPVTFTPLRTWTTSLPMHIPEQRLRIRIAGDRFEYSGNPEAAAVSRPVQAPADFDWTSAYGLWVKGKELIRQRAYTEAESAVDECLRKDPNYVPALADKALLRYRAGDDARAFEAARRALSIDTYDPAANYYYGLSAHRLGQTADARDGFDVAAQSVEYRAAALAELARLSLGAGDFRAARDYATRGVVADHASLAARQLLAVANRLTGRAADARATLRDLLARDPLNHCARFEAYRLDPSAATRQAFVGGVRNELPHETYLELATWYHALSLDAEAREVLAFAPAVAEVLYWRAYLNRARAGFDVRDALARAADASPLLVFPFRRESVPVFAWAIEHDGGWKPAYYLALLTRGLGDVQRAQRLLADCGDTPDFAPFYVVRAQLAVAAAPERALADLQRAREIAPREWRIGRLLVERAIGDGRLADAAGLAAGYHAGDPGNYIMGMLHARTLLLVRQYREALDVLSRLKVLPYEGATEGRSLYREANLMLAVDALSSGRLEEAETLVEAARQWPEHLGAGKPYAEDADERLEDWLQAASLEARGEPDAARAALSRIVAFTGPRRGISALVTALALQRLDRAAEIDALFPRDSDAPDGFTTWARRALQGERVGPPPGVPSNEETRILAAWLATRSR